MTAITLTRPRRHVPDARVFAALLSRDVVATARDVPSFLIKTLLQPVLMLFIFGRVLPDLGFISGDFVQVLLPGVVALNAFLGALQATAMPMVMDFAVTREIEDRLLAPVSLSVITTEKIVFGAARGLLAGVVTVPVGFLILDGISWSAAGLVAAFGILVLCALVAAAVGVVMGTFVPPNKIEIIFTATITPLMFTGATQYPWHGLGELVWFQILCAANPLTYASEGLRGVLLTDAQAIPVWICVMALTFATVVLTLVANIGFRRRATG